MSVLEIKKIAEIICQHHPLQKHLPPILASHRYCVIIGAYPSGSLLHLLLRKMSVWTFVLARTNVTQIFGIPGRMSTPKFGPALMSEHHFSLSLNGQCHSKALLAIYSSLKYESEPQMCFNKLYKGENITVHLSEYFASFHQWFTQICCILMFLEGFQRGLLMLPCFLFPSSAKADSKKVYKWGSEHPSCLLHAPCMACTGCVDGACTVHRTYIGCTDVKLHTFSQ